MLIVVDGDVSMSYEHKTEQSSRDPKSILANVLQTSEEEYELDITPVTPEGPDNQTEAKEDDENILPEEADTVITEMDDDSAVHRQSPQPEEDRVEQQDDEDDIDFDPEEPKRAFEKKKKGRDYVEFRDEYW